MHVFSILTLIVGLLSCNTMTTDTHTHKKDSITASVAPQDTLIPNPCFDFQVLNTQIRDGQITPKAAQAQLKALLPRLKAYYQYQLSRWQKKDDTQMVFPLVGYNTKAIGGENGSGYLPKGYDYFQGNKHTGHPAHDIFILDKNQDSKDDNTLQPVAVVAVTSGLVVAHEDTWAEDSPLRGGKYLWIFHPKNNRLYYYAHNDALSVQTGDFVTAGQKIAVVGRTGLNAFKQRSPTHLHLSMLEISEDGSVKSVDIYPQLLTAKVHQQVE